MKELDLDIGDDKGNTPLHLSGKHYKTMKKLLECGANPNCQVKTNFLIFNFFFFLK